jgi:hypothetical protein
MRSQRKDGRRDQRRRRLHQADARGLRRQAVGFQIQRLGQGHLLGLQEQQHPGQQEQERHAGDEDHPAFEEMGEPVQPVGPVLLRDDARPPRSAASSSTP